MCAPGRLTICGPNPTTSSVAHKALYQIKAAGHNRKTSSTQAQRACHASRAVAAEIKGSSLTVSPSREPKSRNCQNLCLCSDAIPGTPLKDVLLCISIHPTLLIRTPPKKSHQLINAVTLLSVEVLSSEHKAVPLNSKPAVANVFPTRAQPISACHKLEQALKHESFREPSAMWHSTSSETWWPKYRALLRPTHASSLLNRRCLSEGDEIDYTFSSHQSHFLYGTCVYQLWSKKWISSTEPWPENPAFVSGINIILPMPWARFKPPCYKRMNLYSLSIFKLPTGMRKFLFPLCHGYTQTQIHTTKAHFCHS